MSTIKVNTITKRTGSTLTLGESGTAVTLACGATQSGFGRSGSVNWQTTPKTATFTAVNGEGYFANTSGGAFTINLPAGSAGAIVAVADYTRTFATNNLTIAPNGSEKIGGVAESVLLDINGQALTLVYVDATEGWINVQNAEDTETGVAAAYVTATGGTVTTSGDFKIHTFNSDATFTVSCAGNPKGSSKVDYLVVAGGGAGGGNDHGGGGGAGGYRFSDGTSSGCYSAGPAPLSAPGLSVSAQAYPITVGAGGTAGSSPTGWRGNNGSNSIFDTITSAGGGGGASNGPGGPGPVAINGKDGGSGGGGAGISGGSPSPCGVGGSGNTPPVSPPQGNNGGNGAYASNPTYATGGGGGASAAGGTASGPQAGNGGAGLASTITASPVSRGGGGGGSTYPGGTNGTGGTGGGGAGVTNTTVNPGTVNTGGGGGGLSQSGCVPGGLGGSGVVIIRYKFQN
tara:strand:+ start:645 stop:2015 length:1371 start_codon:yes stop_codon:yes gene_type:complete